MKTSCPHRSNRWMQRVVARGAFAFLSGCVLAAPAAGQTSIIGFDFFLDGTPIGPRSALSTQWTEIGVVFADGKGQPVSVSNNSCSLSMPNHAFAGVIVATFVDPCTGGPAVTASAGTAQDNCWFPGEGIDMKAFDSNGNLLAQQFNAGGGNLVVFSFEKPVIARIEMACALQGIDNFQFTAVVPIRSPDLDGDGDVDGSDLGSLLGEWGPCAGCCAADLNLDGEVDGSDLGTLLGAWTG